MSGYVAYPHQIAADDTSEPALLGPRRRALIVAATGTGKTVTFVLKIERWRPRGRALVLTHREELGDQAAAAVEKATALSVGIDRAEHRITSGALPDVVVASTPTLLSAARLGRYKPDDFALVVCDEGHHYPANGSAFSSVPLYFRGAALLGVTATPDRADSMPLIFGPAVYRYGIRPAIREGYLANVWRAVEPLHSLDLGKFKVRGSGDWTDGELERELITEQAIASVADAILRHAGERPTVAFCAGVLHSRLLAAALNVRRPGCAVFASGEDRGGVALFKAGKYQILTNADLTVEGFDHPPVSCVCRVRPTLSLPRATQQTGRGTRLSPSTGKDRLIAVEFRGMGASEQIRTVDVIGPDFTERARSDAEQLLVRNPSMSVLDALERCGSAQGEKPLSAAAIALRAVIDPMDGIMHLRGMVMVERTPGARAATIEQMATLHSEGMRCTGLDVRQAAMLSQGIRWRRDRGYSSPSQALALYSYGQSPDIGARDALKRLALRSA